MSECSCIRCTDERIAALPVEERLSAFRGMSLCPDCGNKRCPKATSHGNACTGSNEVGQAGSVWEKAQPPAVHHQDNPAYMREQALKSAASWRESAARYRMMAESADTWIKHFEAMAAKYEGQ